MEVEAEWGGVLCGASGRTTDHNTVHKQMKAGKNHCIIEGGGKQGHFIVWKWESWKLFVVIGFTAKDSHGAINLYGKEESHHLVRKSELRQ